MSVLNHLSQPLLIMSVSLEQQFHSDFSKKVYVLEQARKKINAQINDSLRRDDTVSIKIYTKLYLMVYSAWTEASLIRLVHTPFGFSNTEKKLILKDKDVLNKWRKCVSTAFSKFRKSGSDIPNKKKKIQQLLDDYLKSQGNIRNKIAHGQWEYPLHKNNITHDPEAEIMLSLIDVIQIDTWFLVFREVVEIVRGLIDAREKNNHKAHYNHYFLRLANIQGIIDTRRKFSIQEKVRKLKLKPKICP